MAESLDDLLAQIKTEYQEKDQGKPPEKKPLLDEDELKSPTTNSSRYQPISSSPSSRSPVEDSILSELKAEFEEKEREAQRKRQQQRQEEQETLHATSLQVKQRQQRKREALKQQAQEWLNNLKPHSEEGLWFEEFSYSYPSKLEAAMDYLQALRETP
ncbi:salt stress protein, Slr1339 family [Coleofasciculus sp. G2-EDA-02]|uniref:salt stress protein, Slr1339 family n=1 Tax=Coleofasciculus sp. G2-EDA-02 TaxID=3069529 RepID=UPI0032FD3B7F